MMCIDLGDLPSWITAFAAVAGLWFVYKQLKGLNEQTRLQTYSDYTRRYEAIVARLPEDVNSESFVLKKGEGEYDSTMRAMRSYFDLCFEEWDLHRKRLIEDRFWQTWSAGISTAMSKTAFQQAWKITKASSRFGQEFERFLESNIPRGE